MLCTKRVIGARVTPFSAHCISDHRISDQKVRTVMVRAIVRVRVRVRVGVRVRVRLGDAVVRNAVGRKVGNRSESSIYLDILKILRCRQVYYLQILLNE